METAGMSLFSQFIIRNRNPQTSEENVSNATSLPERVSIYESFQNGLQSLKVPERLEEGIAASKVYLASWLERAGSFSEVQVRKTLAPLEQKVSLYSEKGENVLDQVLKTAMETEQKLLEIAGGKDLAGDPRPASMLEWTFQKAKQILQSGVAYVAGSVEKLLDYIGTRVLGDDRYNSLKKICMGYAGRIGEFISNGIQSAFDALFKGDDKDKDRRKEKQLSTVKEISYATDTSEVRQAREHVSDLVQELSFFKSREGADFLARNILDSEEDGILRNRPDAIRQELTKFERPAFDPFPSRHTREEREKQDKKAKIA
jgi:hypothetical protein